MPQFLLDTDHLTLYSHKHPSLMRRIASCAPGDVALNPISVEEALKGRLVKLSGRLTGTQRIQAYKYLVEAVELCHLFPIVPFDQASETRFQTLVKLYRRLGTQDQKIAAIALANNLTLLTRNRRHFGQIAGLVIADWSL